MKPLAAALLLWLGALPALAQRVEVVSGAHEGFARLALVLPGPAGWSLTRTEGGYALRVEGAGLRYDLSGVFRLIPRDRLAAIWVDPGDGALHLGVACACHALPFELRPGVIVIDIRDGAPPPGSAFETAADGKVLPPLAARSAQRPRPRPPALTAAAPSAGGAAAAEGAGPSAAASGYDWLDLHRPNATPDTARKSAPEPHGVTPAPMPAATEFAEGAALQQDLLHELARAAARGAVEIGGAPPPPGAPATAGALAQLHIGGISAHTPGIEATVAAVTGEGVDCLPDSAVDVGAWGGEGPAAALIGEAKTGLLGEFDRPDAEAAARLVRAYLHLGFGVEARQAAAAFAPQDKARPLWDALALILDGQPSPGPVFAGAEACDGWVALWAVLAGPALPASQSRQDGAVLRAFSALPAHLRRHLGPPLAERYLAAGLDAPARAIADAIQRAPGEADPATRLLEHHLDTALGEPVAEGDLHGLAAEPGETGLRATLAAIEAEAAEGPVSTELRLAAEALRRIHDGTPAAAEIDAAVALALASQGDFAGAFALVAPESPQSAPIWDQLAGRGGDGALLDWAVRAEAPPLPADLRRRLAGRLVDLGFAEPALVWLGPPDDGSEAAVLLRAAAELQRNDARAALRLLDGVEGDAAEALRHRAAERLDPGAAGGDDALAALLAGRDWSGLAASGEAPWSAAAARVVPVAAGAEAGPLAAGRALVEESAAARADLEALLAATPTDRSGASGTDHAPEPAPVPEPAPEPTEAAPVAVPAAAAPEAAPGH